MIKERPHKYIFNKAAFFIIFLFPLLFTLKSILEGSIPFWFDPARDFLLALENLRKPRLIGQPTGIPGIFYGPYWIWFISTGMLFSKNPRFITTLILVLPYFTIFPFIIFKFAKIFGRKVCSLIWLLFILGFLRYTNFLWNPHLAPLLFLALIYLLIFTNFDDINLKNNLKIFCAGFISGLLANFHLSLGIVVFLSTALFFLIDWVSQLKGRKDNWIVSILNRVGKILIFLLGAVLSFLPSIVFEFRHGFNQARAMFKILSDAIFYNSASVGQTGLGKTQIIQSFFAVLDTILKTPSLVSYVITLATTGYIFFQIKRKKFNLNKPKRKLFILLVLLSDAILFVYLSSKNPVWSYHFIGVEIIFLLFIAIIVSELSLFKRILLIWVCILFSQNIISFVKSFKQNPYFVSSLVTKERIVKQIYKDVKSKPFSVFVYSPAIYTYDYDYLFLWLGKDRYRYLPEDPSKTEFTYLIVPQSSEEIKTDFIHYRTPDEDYQTEKEWTVEDGTLIIKRVKK